MFGLIPAENWEYSILDGIRCLRMALVPSKGGVGNTLEGMGDFIPARSARASIVTALKALDLPSGSSIAVPLYSCPVVFKAIVAAGHVPTFIDIDSETFCISCKDLAAKISSTKAVIAIHMFGHICDMPLLKEIAQLRPVLEDCAQSLGSKLNDRLTGTFGTIGAFSFRSGKYLSVGEGGALFTHDQVLYSRLTDMTSSLPSPGLSDELKHIAITYMRSALRRKPLWGMLGYHIWNIYSRKVDYKEQSPLVLQQTYQTDMLLVKHRLHHLDANISAQRTNAVIYAQTLDTNLCQLYAEKPGVYLNRYLYPVLFQSSKERDYVADILFRQRIGSIKPYQNIAEVAASNYGYKGGCPNAEDVSKRILALPVYHTLKKSDIQKISNCVNQALMQVKLKGR
jgi:perosamine synthetase